MTYQDATYPKEHDDGGDAMTSPDDDVRRAEGNWVFMEGAVAAASRTIEAMKREAQELANGES